MKGLIFIHLICFALGANQTLKNLISDGHYVPLIEELSEVNAGQKMVILIDVETNSSLRTCLQNAYSNKNVTLFCIHLPKREIPDIEYHIETIGDNVAELIFNMCKNNTININNLELVCNGIGCDVAGIAGKKFTQRKLNENQLRKIPNIIAFNPTGLNKFEDFDLNSNLQPEDADKVVVFHTNDAFRGDGTRLGTLDIFLNGDAYQPSCVSEENADKCSHQFACEFYAGLLTNTDVTMIAYDYEKFVEAREEGDIHIAQGEQLSSLDQLLSKTGSYIVKTTPKRMFSIN
ncbi:lipase member H-like isoform X1 [Contarinia nasturtii]|uniref:lipase member H-like isoform X1 n=1 Tax=Contarinia nasturtii TaxID=265458 RepID=UPI0012D49560|nr:lipase member H-like isoform X1 [Contarinia nasturtii]